MANEPSQLHDYERASARSFHVRDRNGSHSAPCIAYEASTYDRHRSHDGQTSNQQAFRANNGSNGYPHEDEESDTGIQWNSRLQGSNPYHAHLEPQHYHDVPRPWQSMNPEVYGMLNAPALAEATARLEGRNHRHNRSFARQQHPRLADHHQREGHSPDPYNTSRPLGYSNLRNLNRDRSPRSATQRWLNEDQRAGPYDHAKQVNACSKYDQRAPYWYQGEDPQYQEDQTYEGHDDRSDTLH